MAKSSNVAITLLKKSIELGKDDPRYYMDFVKLHKLMYLAQCYLSFKWEMNLFEEQVIARDDGPYIEGLHFITAMFGFGEIKNIEEQVVALPLSISRKETCDIILDLFGKCDTDEIVHITKRTLAYRKCYIKGNKNIIPNYLMAETGRELFEDKNLIPVQKPYKTLSRIPNKPKR